uniref:LIM zinc-binding domain-containing protein n=1 Tax=Astatotilapia calliptera TaxID=8154 RepID=A0AAX7SZR4_ASTCA
MASAAPPKRVVSSVFITLASPHRATVTPQQQPALQAHSAPAREKLHPAVRVSPGDSIPALRHSREDKSPPSESNGGLKIKGLTNAGSSALVSGPQSHNPPKHEPGKTQLQEKNDQRSSSELFPPPPPPSDAPPLCPGELPSEESALPPPPPAQASFPHPVTPGQQPVYNPEASLELCWACGEAITDHIIRALERAYHLSCFTCTTCKRQIGEQAFAQGEVGEVYCLQDYYRKYAPKCSACNQLIIPQEDGTDSYTVECLGRSYHENCYRCEVCAIQLSPEPNEHGCYPLDGKMLCKPCHLNLASGQH